MSEPVVRAGERALLTPESYPGAVGCDVQFMRVVMSEPVVVCAAERALLTPESYPGAVGCDVQLTRVVMSELVVACAG